MTGTSAACLHTNQSRSYLSHLVFKSLLKFITGLIYSRDFRKEYCDHQEQVQGNLITYFNNLKLFIVFCSAIVERGILNILQK
jgi:hypothetical protein